MDGERGGVACKYSTAENMVHRARARAGETVLGTGARGGVGAAAIQLVKRRKARVIAVVGRDKVQQREGLGADEVLL